MEQGATTVRLTNSVDNSESGEVVNEVYLLKKSKG